MQKTRKKPQEKTSGKNLRKKPQEKTSGKPEENVYFKNTRKINTQKQAMNIIGVLDLDGFLCKKPFFVENLELSQTETHTEHHFTLIQHFVIKT